MAAESVKLLSAWASPFAMRAHLAVELKGIEYENITQDLRIHNKSQLLLESNPVHKKVPVLIHNGKSICESSIIVEYVNDAWPDLSPCFFPKDAYGRAEQRFWGDFVDRKIIEVMLKVVRSKDEESAAAANKEFTDNLKVFEGELSKRGLSGPFFGGESMSYVDVMLAPFALWILAALALGDVVGLKMVNEEECPKLHKLFNSALESPAAKVALPEKSKLSEFINTTLPYLQGRIAQ